MKGLPYLATSRKQHSGAKGLVPEDRTPHFQHATFTQGNYNKKWQKPRKTFWIQNVSPDMLKCL